MLQVRIPDDRSSRSQFAIIDDDLEQQLRDILEANITAGDSSVFVMAKAQYKSCMDTDRLEVIGLKPLRDLLTQFGGWPVVDGDSWDEDGFDWLVQLYSATADLQMIHFIIFFTTSIPGNN